MGGETTNSTDFAALFQKSLKESTRQLCYQETKDEADVTQSFKLKGHEFFDLCVYVDTGLALPKDNSAFEAQMAKEDLKDISTFDPNFYGDIETCWVGIQDNCAKYNDEGMPLFKQTTEKISTFCANAARYIGGQGMLEDGLTLIFDNMPNKGHFPKKGEATVTVVEDKATVQTALGLCAYILSVMKTEVEGCESKCKDLVAKLQSFESLSQVDAQKIHRLDENFSGSERPKDSAGNPIMKDGKELEKNYTELLNNAVTELTQKIKDEKAELEKDERDHKISASFAGTGILWCAVLPPLGCALAAGAIIGGSIIAAQKQDEIDRLNKKLGEENAHLTGMLRCAVKFKTVTAACKDLDKKIQAALKAAKALEKTFTQMNMDLTALFDAFNAMSKNLEEGWYRMFSRDAIIGPEGALTVAKPKWKQLEILCNDFILNSSLMYFPAGELKDKKAGDKITNNTFTPKALGEIIGLK